MLSLMAHSEQRTKSFRAEGLQRIEGPRRVAAIVVIYLTADTRCDHSFSCRSYNQPFEYLPDAEIFDQRINRR